MVDEREQLDRYLAQYDDLAMDVLDDGRSNTRHGIPWSNAALAQAVLQGMDWEYFDLFAPVDYEGTYASDDADTIQCYAFIAFLRMMLFSAAYAAGVGEPEFNKSAAASSEYWFKRLWDRHEALEKGEDTPKPHKWIH